MMEYFNTIHLTTIIILVLVGLIVLFIWNVFQKKNTILRCFPIIGYIPFLAEGLGYYLRTYFYVRDREELPFNRAERAWVDEAARNVDTTVGFGSTRDRRPVGTIYFVDSPFPLLGREVVQTRPVVIGQQCPHPYTTSSLINISAMSYGSISKNAVLALSHGAKMAGCWLNTGEGGYQRIT